MKKFAVLILTIALLAGMASCTKKTSTDIGGDVIEEPANSPEIVEPEPESEPPYTNPLTGLKTYEDMENLRPFAVIFNDKIEALPQLGICSADIIYEICAEGGITRLQALFQSMQGVGEIGSVRSTRPYYVEVAAGYDAIIIHAGGSEEAYEVLKKWKMVHFDGVRGGHDAKIFWRDEERLNNVGYEHSLLTSGENILEYLNSTKIRKEHEEGYEAPMKFGAESAAVLGSPALNVTVKFSRYKSTELRYDAESQNYSVYGHDRECIDGNTSEQLRVKNLLVLNTTTKVLDSEGRLKVEVTGSGSGMYFCEGKGIEISWSRDGRNDPFRYELADGSELSFMPGKSYICMINPKVSKLIVEK